MKKYSFVSITLILCLLISSMGTLPVFADTTEETLLFELNMSGFVKGAENESWGLTGTGADAQTTKIMAREGHIVNSKTATGSTSLKTFVNAAGEDVAYINQGLANSGNSGRSSTTENSRIHIENEAWSSKATTTEIWVNQTSKASGGAYLNLYVDDADSDRVTYDYNMRILKGYNPKNNQFNLYTNTDGVNNVTATQSKSYFYYKAEESTWYMHTVVATPIDEDSDGTDDTMVYKLYIDDETSGAGYMELTVPIKEGNTYGVLLGQVRKNNYASPNPLKIGSVKVYDGALTTTQIAAHYNAEKSRYNEGPATLELTEALPADGSTIGCHEGKFTLTFNNTINAATLENGIVLKNVFGETVPTNKTLSEDKLTVTVDAGYVTDGTFTLSVTEDLMSVNKKNAAAVTYTYTAEPLEYASDFDNSEKWSHGTAHSYTEFNAIDSYIKSPTGSSFTNSTLTVNADGSVTSRGDGNKSYPPTIKMTVGEQAIYSGTLVFDYDFKLPENYSHSAGSVSYNTEDGSAKTAYLFAVRPETEHGMQLYTMQTMDSNNSASTAVAPGGYAEGGWFRMRVVLTKNKDAGWTANVYNLDYSDSKSIITVNITGAVSINALNTASYWKSSLTWTVRNIAVKHTGSYIGGVVPQSLSGYERVNFSADVNTVNENAVIIAALYYDNQLKAVKTFDWADVTDGKISGTFTNLTGINSDPTVKIMMWDNLENLNPLTESVEETALIN